MFDETFKTITQITHSKTGMVGWFDMGIFVNIYEISKNHILSECAVEILIVLLF